MTVAERRDTSIMNASRKKRIADGSGTLVPDVNRVLKDFNESRKLMKSISEMGGKGKKGFGNMKFPF
jgi:signal recognition particle subunit SRP54